MVNDTLAVNTTGAIISLLRKCSGDAKIKLKPQYLYMIAYGLDKEHSDLSSTDLAIIFPALKYQNDSSLGVCQIYRVIQKRIPNEGYRDIRSQTCLRLFDSMYAMNSDHQDVRDMLARITQLYATCKDSPRALDICHAIKGLCRMSSEHKEVLDAVVLLSKSLGKAFISTDSSLSPNLYFTAAAHGLFRMTSNHQEVRYLIRMLSLKLTIGKPAISSVYLASWLYNMRGMESHHYEVRLLLASLLNCHTGDTLRPRDAGKALNGMRNMSSGCEEVRRVLTAIQGSLDASGEWHAESVQSMLFGMCNMSCDHKEVRDIVAAVTSHVKVGLFLNWEEISRCLLNIRHWSSDYPEVRELVAALLQAIKAIEGSKVLPRPTMFMIAQSIHGLQNMTANHHEVEAMMQLLLQYISQSQRRTLSAGGLSQLLYGASLYYQTYDWEHGNQQHLLLSVSGQMRDRVEDLLQSRLHDTFDLFDVWGAADNSRELLELCRAAQLFSFMSKGSGMEAQWQETNQSLLELVEARMEAAAAANTSKRERHGGTPSPKDRLAQAVWKAVHTSPGMQVMTKNAMLRGFECDVLIVSQSSTVNGEVLETFLDVEIDGPEDSYPGPAIEAIRRDAYLQSLPGVSVLRVALFPSDPENCSKAEHRSNVIKSVMNRLGLQYMPTDDDLFVDSAPHLLATDDELASGESCDDVADAL
jgi:hypothetical protein